jgi:hypothetical protein
MSGSSTAFSSLDPQNLPTDPTSLDIWILRDQNIILSTHIISEESMNLQFAGFIKNILTTFGQVITVTPQPFHQALVLREKIFSFERMDSNIKYAAKTNKRVLQIATLFQQIVTQELSFLSQLQAFTKMLLDANIFTTPPPAQSTTPQVTRNKRRIAQFNSSNKSCNNCGGKMSNSFNKILHSNRNKRNIFDIFTPYSVNELGSTANQNYQLVNRNFANVHITEKKLTHAQKQLHENFASLDTKEKALFRKELYLELRSLRSTYYSDFLFDLKEILKTNQLDKSYAIIFELLRNEEFCFESRCYSLPIFSVLNDNIIQITVEMSSQRLSKAEYISCTILPNERTSIYSHQLAILRDGKLHFNRDDLPSISFLQLKDPKIDARTRPISEEDKMEDIFYPIYSNEKVSLQCMSPQRVEIDGEIRYCDQNSLEFGPFPKEIRVGGTIVLSLHVPNHFSQKLAWVNEDFSSITTFKEKNSTNTPFVQDVIGFFETAQPIHYSLMATTCLVILVLSILCCCAIYMNCPTLLAKLLCCCNNRCGFKQKVQDRVAYCKNSQPPPAVVNPRSRDQPVSGPNQDQDNETSFMIDRTDPESQTTDQDQPIIKNQAPSVGMHSSLCARGYRGCLCLRDQHQCYGPQGKPPSYGQLTN